MRLFLQTIIITIILFALTLSASQARGGLITFTQPDGTQFEGYLKGDPAFHWIESGSHVVLYNPEDKFYYNAKIGSKNEFELTKERPAIKRAESENKLSAMRSTSFKKLHAVDVDTQAALQRAQKASREGDHPR